MPRVSDSKQGRMRRISLSFLVLIPIVVACVLVSRAHILEVGGSYELSFPEYAGREITAASIQVDPPGTVGIGDIWQDSDGITHVLFEAGNPGKCAVSIGFEDTGMLFEMQTTASGVVIAEGLDMMGWEYICVSAIIVMSCVSLLCVSAAVSLWRVSWYGYEMAAFVGGALFFLLQTIQLLALYAGGSIDSFSRFATAVITMANSFVEVSAIPMALLALFVSASNVVLLQREGRAFTNLLGVIATVFWAAAFFGLRAIRDALFNVFMNPLLYVVLDSALSAILAYGVALFLGVCVTAVLAALHVPSFPRDYAIILGCGLREDGTPTPLLAGRVDAALAYAERQQAAGFEAPTFVPSGGQGSDEACSEAASMVRYIGEHAEGSRVLLEDRSTTTRENMAFSAEVIADDAAGTEKRIAFSTTNYHVLRGYVFAHMAGMDAEGIAAPTKLYFWPNAFLREFVGMLAARALPIAMNGVAIIALYGFLEFLLVSR